MEKRDSERIPAKIGIQLFSNNRTIYGTIENCSDRGLYIKAMISFPFDSTFEVLIPFKKKTFKVPVKLVRLEKTGDIYDGMGGEVLELKREYLEFLISLKF